MADKPAHKFDNYEIFKAKIKAGNDEELALFKRFYDDVNIHANSHKHITLANLDEVKESLDTLKERALKLRESLFYHDETVIVDRQEVISDTEKKVHKENLNILNFERNQASDKIENLDYLNKVAIQNKFNFFTKYIDIYAKTIMNFDETYDYYEGKTTSVDKIFNKYKEEILESFNILDQDIAEMDSRILDLMKQKNSKLNDINSFYNRERKNFVDNQLTFSLAEDPTSVDIQALISDKIFQQEAFKKHILHQEVKVQKILNNEYNELYQKTLDRLLNQKGFQLFQDVKFFDHPDKYIENLKQKLVFAKENEEKGIASLIRVLKKAENHEKIKTRCEKRAKGLTKRFLHQKKKVFLEYQKDARNLIFQMEKYYRLYLELLKIDPFLAQIIGDNATKIIKDELNFLSMLEMNKEYKINVNFDIKMLKIKQQINEIEAKLIHQIDRLTLLQDIDLLYSLQDIQIFFYENKIDAQKAKNKLLQEKFSVDLLEDAINAHMEHLINMSNVNRKWLSVITEMLISRTRSVESHNMNVIDAASKIKLALKEYDVNALHFNTMYENERKYLVMQANRVDEESEINNQFILTTYENQMRFAKEQVELANTEYRLRVEAIIRAVEEEKNFYQEIIDRRLKEHRDKRKVLEENYQARLYYETHSISESDDPKLTKQLEKQIQKNKKSHDKIVKEMDAEIAADAVIAKSRARLTELEEHTIVALQDATELRDETISEMSELYDVAEKKYQALKPYLKDRIHILEPSLNSTLTKIKERRNYRLKMAEIELETATKDLLENYLHVFFEEMPDIDREKYLAQIDTCETEREQIQADYAGKMEAIDKAYRDKIQANEKENYQLNLDFYAIREEIKAKSDKFITQKKAQIDELEQQHFLESEKRDESFQNEINKMLQEFNSSLVKNQKDFKSLSSAFDKILKTYYPYLKVASNNKAIKKIVKQTEKKIRIKKQREIKKLHHKSNLTNYLSN